jgi:hypothetical protein
MTGLQEPLLSGQRRDGRGGSAPPRRRSREHELRVGSQHSVVVPGAAGLGGGARADHVVAVMIEEQDSSSPGGTSESSDFEWAGGSSGGGGGDDGGDASAPLLRPRSRRVSAASHHGEPPADTFNVRTAWGCLWAGAGRWHARMPAALEGRASAGFRSSPPLCALVVPHTQRAACPPSPGPTPPGPPGSGVNLTKVILGAGMMAVPKAFQMLGAVPGTAFFVAIGWLTHVTLARGLIFSTDAAGSGTKSYAALVRGLLGPRAEAVLQLSVFTT